MKETPTRKRKQRRNITASVQALDKHLQALELRKGGASYQQIAQALGYSGPSGAFKAVETALKESKREAGEELRTLELERLDSAFLAIWTYVKNGHLGAMDRMLRIMERRARLLGLDKPTKVQNLDIDLSKLTDEQLLRIAAGEDPTNVLADTRSSGS